MSKLLAALWVLALAFALHLGTPPQIVHAERCHGTPSVFTPTADIRGGLVSFRN